MVHLEKVFSYSPSPGFGFASAGLSRQGRGVFFPLPTAGEGQGEGATFHLGIGSSGEKLWGRRSSFLAIRAPQIPPRIR